MTELHGVIAALSTPFDETGERLDEAGLRNHLDSILEAGVHGIVLCAGTGEFAYLREEEKSRILEIGIQHVARRVPVVAQTSAINTADTIEKSKRAEAMGADALMILPPYFEGPGLDGVLYHFERIAAAVSTPIVLYNIPQHSDFDITPEIYARLLELDNVEYIKDSKGDMVNLQQLIAAGGKVLSGADPLAPFALMAGAAGWIWGAANAMPRESVELYDHITAGRHGEALALWRRMEPANLFFWSHPYNVAVKQATEYMGRPVGPCRKPSVPLRDEEWAELKAALDLLR
jgi:4-hydroxy-tetrahydrodipicolinate synthase